MIPCCLGPNRINPAASQVGRIDMNSNKTCPMYGPVSTSPGLVNFQYPCLTWQRDGMELDEARLWSPRHRASMIVNWAKGKMYKTSHHVCTPRTDANQSDLPQPCGPPHSELRASLLVPTPSKGSWLYTPENHQLHPIRSLARIESPPISSISRIHPRFHLFRLQKDMRSTNHGRRKTTNHIQVN